jgi:hypothetical protein
MVTDPKQRRVRSNPFVFACTALPIAAILALYAFAVRARFSLGYWPAPYRPDPEDLGFSAHYDLVMALFNAALASPIPVVVILAWVATRSRQYGQALRSAGVFAAVYGAMFAIMWWDPGSVFEWYAD